MKAITATGAALALTAVVACAGQPHPVMRHVAAPLAAQSAATAAVPPNPEEQACMAFAGMQPALGRLLAAARRAPQTPVPHGRPSKTLERDGRALSRLSDLPGAQGDADYPRLPEALGQAGILVIEVGYGSTSEARKAQHWMNAVAAYCG